jgi:cytoskeletal protein CcmA (bactofilin family)
MIFDKKPTEYGQPSVIVPMPKAGSPSHGLPPCAIIDAGLHIEGDLATDRDVQVDGHINGNVSCARLTIGKDGAITGDIKAKEIVVRGKVKGTIRATRVMLMEGADVAGDIYYDRMSMEEGAHFVGSSYAGPQPCTASPPDEKIS